MVSVSQLNFLKFSVNRKNGVKGSFIKEVLNFLHPPLVMIQVQVLSSIILGISWILTRDKFDIWLVCVKLKPSFSINIARPKIFLTTKVIDN